ncbi:hypothetical protein [Brevibacillus fulvus]|uniref:Uncharacterized protein n=1 Tax=Brevibacillus fulvus TaxID=1125967 RepID=A0A938XX71_9BACL|nr:hypothetical protein [Brevibacillus fulvus]MBM7589794.1 hypothetical protein [Brevibacillus fulvus]
MDIIQLIWICLVWIARIFVSVFILFGLFLAIYGAVSGEYGMALMYFAGAAGLCWGFKAFLGFKKKEGKAAGTVRKRG